MKERIGLNDSIIDVVTKLSDGNPGAIHVLMQMLEKGEQIDPQSFMGGLGAVLSLDTHGIYGSRIWMLYKDVCGESIVNTLAVLRACQLGQIYEAQLNTAIDNYGQGLDIPTVLANVKEQLPDFGLSV